MNDPRVIKFGEWWDGESFTDDNPYHKESFAYWAWEGWQAGWNAKGASTVERLTDFERGYEQGKADAINLLEQALDYLASYTVGERPNASEVNDFIFILEAKLKDKNT
jgi:hypothetical protein